jgi:hypothetical protein
MPTGKNGAGGKKSPRPGCDCKRAATKDHSRMRAAAGYSDRATAADPEGASIVPNETAVRDHPFDSAAEIVTSLKSTSVMLGATPG